MVSSRVVYVEIFLLILFIVFAGWFVREFKQADVYVCTYYNIHGISGDGVLKPVCVLNNGSESSFCWNCDYRGRLVTSVENYLFNNNTSIFYNIYNTTT